MEANSTPTSEQAPPAGEPPPADAPSPRHHRRPVASPDTNTSADQTPTDNNPSQSQPPPASTMDAGTPQSADSPNPPPSRHPQAHQEPPDRSGQGHDRMETDDDSDDSRSRSGTETPEHSVATTEPAPQPAPSGGEALLRPPDLPVSANPSNVEPTPPSQPSSQDVITSTTIRFGVTANVGINQAGIATLLDPPSLSFNFNGIDQPAGDIRVTIPDSALETARNNRQPPPPQRDDSVESRTRRERRADERERDHDDNSSDSSDDDEENPYWANFKEDTSAPDERELKIIEESEKNLPTATDHEHWEKTTFEDLDDPEYVPADVGRINWTVKGVHGTPDKPNKESIMRSPSVKIGDYYWNIKYYPRGNDGTEQVSVYLECSPTRYEDIEEEVKAKVEELRKEDAPMTDAAAATGAPSNEPNPSGTQSGGAPPEEAQVSQSNTSAAQEFAAPNQASITQDPIVPDQSSTTVGANASAPAPVVEDPVAPTQSDVADMPDAASDSDSEKEDPWRVAAQVCCVMYNPNEPRVYASQKSCHSYYNENPDWGWTRFHGPWDDLHQRKRYQRQAMLRGDTLAFTVYVRIVKDETKGLWWHPPKDKAAWDSVEMTGVRGFKAVRPDQSSAIIAALASWLHLRPFLDMIRHADVTDYFYKSQDPPRPMFEELRCLLEEQGDYSNKEKDITLSRLSTLMDASSHDGIKKLDVISLWEHIRRLMTHEISLASGMEEACNTDGDLFQKMLLLKQPDYFGLDPHSRKYQPEVRADATLEAKHEPTSVQEAIDLASQHAHRAFRMWECFPNQQQEPSFKPDVLSIELHRQHFDKSNRRWMKLGHRIALDEEVTMSGHSYTLYGMVVHSGSLESQQFYTVIRPGGPGSRWLKFAGENSPKKVAILTTKQAVSAHEGSGEPILTKKHSDKKKENAAVAYIAMYARTDSIQNILETPFDRKLPDVRKRKGPADVKLPPAEGQDKPVDKAPASVTVCFYFGNAFSGNNELEIFDPWSQKTEEQRQDIRKIAIPENLKVYEIKSMLEHVLSRSGQSGATKPVDLWILDVRQPCLGALPAFFKYELLKDKALEEVPHFSGGCRFWIEAQDLVVLRQAMDELAEANIAEVLEITEKEKAQKEQPAPPAESMSASAGEEAPPADSTVSNTAEPAPPTSAEQPTTNDDSQEVVIVEDAPPPEQGQDEGGDTIMSDAHGTENQPPPPQLDRSNEQKLGPPERQVLCFLKMFDFDTQKLTNFKHFLVPLTANVTTEVKKALGIETKQKSEDEMTDADAPQEEWDIYHERFQWAKSYELVNSSVIFEHYVVSTEYLPSDMSITIPSDGVVFIAQRRPNPVQISALEAAGKPTTAPNFISHLLARAYNPTYSAPTRTTSYLGSPYFSGSQAFSRPHGPGTLVSMTGDHYTGSFSSGRKAGLHGKMIFANKDIFEGAWEHDEPHGEGTMTYAKTGNVYTGGWKRGRRHGKGRMEFETADEEMRLCQVCYEEEMDSLFYACGHVCACEGCARQVENCPVCRERVRGVVKVRWTV